MTGRRCGRKGDRPAGGSAGDATPGPAFSAGGRFTSPDGAIAPAAVTVAQHQTKSLITSPRGSDPRKSDRPVGMIPRTGRPPA
jgi:hypothetical protein